MKRFLMRAAITLALFATSPASAKVLVVQNENITVNHDFSIHNDINVLTNLTTDVLRTFGIEYRVVSAHTNKVFIEYLRTGNLRGDTFDAVIYAGFTSGSGGGGGVTRSDSITLSSYLTSGGRNGILVPQLLIIGHEHVFSTAFPTDAVACSTGITATANPGVGAHNMYGTPWVWEDGGTYDNGWLKNATPPAGGLRGFIGDCNWKRNIQYNSNGAYFCDWCDSLPTGNCSDTLMMWERPMSHITDCKPIIMVSVGGGGNNSQDSTANAGGAPAARTSEYSYDMIACGIARLDSVLGGRLICKPAKVAITIDNTFSYRSVRWGVNGVVPQDTANFAACMDSLDALNVPITFGVNYDSIGSYPEWKRWLRKVHKARYSPQSLVGIDSTQPNLGDAKWQRFIDPLGRLRKRTIVGDGTYLGGDTTYLSGLRRGVYVIDSVFGNGRRSECLLPAADDYLPAQVSGFNTQYNDSILYAIRLAGFSTVRFNNQVNHAQRMSAGPGYTNPIGFTKSEGSQYGSIDGKRLNFVGHNGFDLSGSAGAVGVNGDSSLPLGGDGISGSGFAKQRWLYGIFADQQGYPNEDMQCSFWIANLGTGGSSFLGITYDKQELAPHLQPGMRSGRCQKYSASDFSGAYGSVPTMGLSGGGAPARNGYWAVKGMVSWAKTMNKLAGRTVVDICYPEQLGAR